MAMLKPSARRASSCSTPPVLTRSHSLSVTSSSIRRLDEFDQQRLPAADPCAAVEVGGGQVDRDIEFHAVAIPGLHLGLDPAHDPLRDHRHQQGAFDDRDEFVRADLAELGVRPAQLGFGRGDPAGRSGRPPSWSSAGWLASANRSRLRIRAMLSASCSRLLAILHPWPVSAPRCCSRPWMGNDGGRISGAFGDGQSGLPSSPHAMRDSRHIRQGWRSRLIAVARTRSDIPRPCGTG